MNHSEISQHTVMRAQPQAESKSFDPWLVWVTVRRCWYWAIPVGLVLACVAGFGVLSTFEPRYRASHLIEANEDFILHKGVMPTVEDLARTEKPLLMNEVVLGPVLSDPALRSAPSLKDPEQAERNIRKNLSIATAGSRSRMTVSYEDSDREYAAKVCNAVVSAYMRQRSDLDQKRVSILEGLLEPEIAFWQGRVREEKANVKDWSLKTRGYDPNSPVGVSRNQNQLSLLNTYENDLNNLQVDLVLLEKKLVIEEGEAASAGADVEAEQPQTAAFVPPAMVVTRDPITEFDVATLVESDPKIAEIQQRIARYDRQIVAIEDNGMIGIRRAEHTDYVKSRDELKEKLASIKPEAEQRARAKLQEAIEKKYQSDLKNRQATIDSMRLAYEEQQRVERQNRELEKVQQRSSANNMLRDLIAEKKQRIAVIQGQLDEELAKQNQLIGNSSGLQFAQDDLRRAEEFLTKLEDRVAAIRTERRQVNAVRSVAPATPPSTPVEDIPYKKLLGASGIAFLIPFALGLLWEMRTNRVTDSVALVQSKGLAPVVGELARSPSASSGRHSRGRRVFQESVDTLRANLFLSKGTRDSRSIAIVSSMSGEGKSTAASQLAISLAKASGKTVLLIDADMRCPDQHDHFGISLEPGLSGVLTQTASLDEAIRTDLGDLVHVMPAGRLKASPHRLMTPESMKDLVNQALERYAFVIFDTAPVLSAGETLSVASAVDTTLVCAMRDVTRMDSVVRTTHRLESAGANVAGTIFSGVTPRQYAYRYGDYNYSNFAQLPGGNG
ncbi:AAA family ATPase [Stieleria sp. TO1_6]|uniref:polysaccharide biosynthesis tyrosine autokinase n=1 Tax=Stieleria tagensis TaxID=2956795 RepID=UPI00209B8E88|nr:AAA family ATPase [Stieleria tagensis]MCO8122486.1 AAA family ATPase [Stieleria tagensis]